MAKNKIEDLRNHLFEVIEKLQDGDKDMTTEKAETIASVAQVIVNSAKIEIDYIRATGQQNSDSQLFVQLNDVKQLKAS